MSRPSDWSPLYGADPLPGDAYLVDQLARDLRDIATVIDDEAARMRTMCSNGYWEGEAAQVFDETAKKNATSLAKVYERYDVAAAAVQDYARVLDEEQAETVTLLEQAKELESRRAAAHSRLDADPDPSDDVEPRPGARRDEDTVDGFGAELAGIRAKVEACVDSARRAGNAAAERIAMVADEDGLKDGWLDGASKWVSDHMSDALKKIASIAGNLAAILGLAALLVGWIPVIGQALAAILGAAALLLGVISLLANLLLWFSGDGGLGAVLLDLVGVATFGIGRVAVAGVRSSVAGLRAAGKLSQAGRAATPSIVARGGQVTDDVLDAVARGDLGRAANLAGVSRSSLKGMLGSQLGHLTADFGAGGFRHLTSSVDDALSRGLRDIDVKDALNLKAAGLDALDNLRDLARGSNWQDALTAVRRGTAGPGVISDDLAAQVKHLDAVLPDRELAVLADLTSSLRGSMLVGTGSMLVGSMTDVVSNFTPVLNDVKARGTQDLE